MLYIITYNYILYIWAVSHLAKGNWTIQLRTISGHMLARPSALFGGLANFCPVEHGGVGNRQYGIGSNY